MGLYLCKNCRSFYTSACFCRSIAWRVKYKNQFLHYDEAIQVDHPNKFNASGNDAF